MRNLLITFAMFYLVPTMAGRACAWFLAGLRDDTDPILSAVALASLIAAAVMGWIQSRKRERAS